jgi:hypothetical protein
MIPKHHGVSPAPTSRSGRLPLIRPLGSQLFAAEAVPPVDSRTAGTHIVTESPPLGTIARRVHFFSESILWLRGEYPPWQARFHDAVRRLLNSTEIL